MIKTLKINLAKFIILAFVLFAALFFVNQKIFAQSPSPSGSPTSASEFVFPIKELGDCSDLESCTNYCEDPVNQNSCSTFAKKNGFYQDDVTTYATDEFYEDAQSELGCNSRDGCVNFCSQEANFDACSAFAKRSEIPGGYVGEPDKPEYLTIAQTTLGCD